MIEIRYTQGVFHDMEWRYRTFNWYWTAWLWGWLWLTFRSPAGLGIVQMRIKL